MRKRKNNKINRFRNLAILSFLWIIVISLPIQIALAKSQYPLPQAFFILGGDPAREDFVAKLAPWYPSFDIWISSGPNPQKTKQIFTSAGVPEKLLHIDSSASDTVSNFTSLVGEFKKNHLRHLYLVTSDYHMARAIAIGTIILGSEGIAFTPLSVPSHERDESLVAIARDISRALLWFLLRRSPYMFLILAIWWVSAEIIHRLNQ